MSAHLSFPMLLHSAAVLMVLVVQLLVATTATVTSRCLRVLTAHTDIPVVSQTSVQSAALHSLQVFAQSLIQEIRILLARLSILGVALSIQQIRWNLELERVADDSNDLVDFVCGEFACSLIQVDVALL